MRFLRFSADLWPMFWKTLSHHLCINPCFRCWFQISVYQVCKGQHVCRTPHLENCPSSRQICLRNCFVFTRVCCHRIGGIFSRALIFFSNVGEFTCVFQCVGEEVFGFWWVKINDVKYYKWQIWLVFSALNFLLLWCCFSFVEISYTHILSLI